MINTMKKIILSASLLGGVFAQESIFWEIVDPSVIVNLLSPI